MNTHPFPDPAAQAMFLLDATENDVETAIQLALLNAQKDDIAISRYWVAVAEALTQKEQVN